MNFGLVCPSMIVIVIVLVTCEVGDDTAANQRIPLLYMCKDTYNCLSVSFQPSYHQICHHEQHYYMISLKEKGNETGKSIDGNEEYMTDPILSD